MEWNHSNTRPEPVIVLRELLQPVYVIRVEIQEDGDGFRFLEIKLKRAVWNKGAIISGIVRSRYSADDVEAILSNVLNSPFNEGRLAEYKSLQEWRVKAKDYAADLMAWADEHGIGDLATGQSEQEPYNENWDEQIPDGVDMLMQGLRLLKTQAQELNDEQAAEVPALFPAWADLIGQQVEAGKRLYYGGRLWKVLQAHTIQENWTPDSTPALFTEIVVQGEGEPEIGTLDNPIPYNGNMELEEGKYYSQDGVVYRCIRSTGTPVYHSLSALVGLYVEVVN